MQYHMTLDRLPGTPSAGAATDSWMASRFWMAGRAAADGEPGWIPDPVTAGAYACDAHIAPIVTGHVDRVAVALAVREFMAAARSFPRGPHNCAVDGCDPATCATGHQDRRPVPMTFDELTDWMWAR